MGITFVAMTVHGVYTTHRIAGPVVRLKRTMRDLAARRIPDAVHLRPKDHFKDLADDLNAALAVLREDAARRRKMADDATDKLRTLVRALENRPSDLREATALAHAALDGVEGLASHLAAPGDAAGDARPVPLPEADLPDVIREPLDRIEPAPAPDR
jgi:ABC-type transporter Mla subunit MlaD